MYLDHIADAETVMLEHYYKDAKDPTPAIEAFRQLERFGGPPADMARSIVVFYVPKVEWLLGGSVPYHQLKVATRPKWSQFNPSIVRVGQNVLINVRSSNYEYQGGCYHYVDGVPDLIKTDNVITYVNRDGRPGEHPEHRFESPDAQDGSIILGFEDVRLYRRGNDVFGSATACLDWHLIREIVEVKFGSVRTVFDSPANMRPEQVFKRADPIQITHRLNLDLHHHEKNWAPIVDGMGEHRGWIYQWDPLTILDTDGKIVAMGDRNRTPLARHLRGSSQAVLTQNSRKAIAMCHEVIFYPNTTSRIYVHRLVEIDLTQSEITRVSPLFWFGPEADRTLPYGAEFAAGLCHIEERDTWICTFGQDDAKAWSACFSDSQIEELLKGGEV